MQRPAIIALLKGFLDQILTCSVVSDNWSSKNRSHISKRTIHHLSVSITEELITPKNGHSGVRHIVVKTRIPVRNGGSTRCLQPNTKEKIVKGLFFK